MANEDSIVYRPMGAWAHDVGDYNCRCWIKEDLGGSFVITVVENGVELEREMAGSSDEAQERANGLRPKYEARYLAEIGKRQPGR